MEISWLQPIKILVRCSNSLQVSRALHVLMFYFLKTILSGGCNVNKIKQEDKNKFSSLLFTIIKVHSGYWVQKMMQVMLKNWKVHFEPEQYYICVSLQISELYSFLTPVSHIGCFERPSFMWWAFQFPELQQDLVWLLDKSKCANFKQTKLIWTNLTNKFSKVQAKLCICNRDKRIYRTPKSAPLSLTEIKQPTTVYFNLWDF